MKGGIGEIYTKVCCDMRPQKVHGEEEREVTFLWSEAANKERERERDEEENFSSPQCGLLCLSVCLSVCHSRTRERKKKELK